MDANIPITVAAPKSGDPDGQPETGSSPLVAGSSPQRRGSRANSAALDEREAAELVRIEGRLMAAYGPSLGPDAVMRCIAEAIDHFDERDLAVERFLGQSNEHQVSILDVGVAHGVAVSAKGDMAGRDRERIWSS